MTYTQPSTPNYLLDLLHKSGVRPSVHRLAVLRYVIDKKTHPTADEIFSSLAAEFPSLSRATVYNSLHKLADSSILREVEIENGTTRYDFAQQPPHGHFKCRRCGKIYDMPMSYRADEALPDGFRIDSIDVYAKGCCSDCCDNIKTK
ncbi:MAG: transcriptional repressor [Candidatus Amulumruptor caecigallinarius]|uniref:Transcriptional repressor n=1 Tax=Candidatus Amulumruptor caecigallinarius TaxID=2109911 RepID=A0A4Q0U876_9BACT|nr:MAG: transcriptional repressor [Candidatus Amulumruptor caecigallinarius]HJE38885.1 transcriptional repressor [Candidatus Amulumruptor caecigallinarius]